MTHPQVYLAGLALLAAPLAQAVTCASGLAPSNPDSAYVDHGDGTVTDLRSGLMWDKCTWGQGWDGVACSGTAASLAWGQALAASVAANAAGHRGHGDWRLPSILELRSLVEECRSNPAINDSLFPHTSSWVYWSGSPSAGHPTLALGVYFREGEAGYGERSGGFHLRLVRSAPAFSAFDRRADYIPEALGDYSSQADVPAGLVSATAEAKTIRGLSTVTGIKVEGQGSPQYQIDGGAWTSKPGFVQNGDVVKVRHTASVLPGARVDTLLTVGGATARFSTTTSSTAVPPPAAGGGGGALPAGGASLAVSGTDGTTLVYDNGSVGSIITLAAGSRTQVALPGGGQVGVQSAAPGVLAVAKAEVDGKNTLVLQVTGGTATVTAGQAGQATVAAGGITVVAGRQGGSQSVTVDPQAGVSIQVEAGDRVIVSSGVQQARTTLELSAGANGPVAPVSVEIGGRSVQFAPVGGNARIAFDTVEVNGVSTPVPTLVSGELRLTVPASCVPMLSVKNTPVSAASAGTQADVGTAGGMVSVTMTAGQGLIGICTTGTGAASAKAGRLAGEPVPVYAGETAEFTAQGEVARIRLGSMGRDQAWPGDPLPLAGFAGNTLVEAPVFRVEGWSARVGADFTAAVLAAIDAGTGNAYAYQSAGQNATTGVWTLRSPHPTANGTLVVWPVGDPVADQGADTLRLAGNGMVQVRGGGLLASFAPALEDPQGFAAELAALGADSLAFRRDGTLHATFGGSAYVVQPDWEVLGQARQGFDLADDRLAWTDAAGNSQRLNPAFADLGRLVAVFRAEDPGFLLNWAWRGEVSVAFAGVPMVLLPDSLLQPAPPEHAQDAWWIDGAKVYLRYPAADGKAGLAQGFAVRLP